MERVAALIREAAAAEILPRFRALASHEISEKRPGDLVTAADRAVEARLAHALAEIAPGAVVGEEATHDRPDLVAALEASGSVWVIDPVDGTGNFVAGRAPFAVMVARVEQSATRAAWIHFPLDGTMVVAERGAGAFADGVRLATRPESALERMTGGVLTRFLPTHLRAAAEAAVGRFAGVSAFLCAGREHVAVARGEKQFALFWRTLPWDHLAGALVVTEAGGAVARLDGTAYGPGLTGAGLLTAADSTTWRTVHEVLVPGVAVVGRAWARRS